MEKKVIEYTKGKHVINKDIIDFIMFILLDSIFDALKPLN